MDKNATPSRQRYSFPTPGDLGEAKSRMDELNSDMVAIDLQLSNKDRRLEGERMSSSQYHDWRRRALTARAAKRNEFAFLKAWIDERVREQRMAVARAAALSPDGPESLLIMLYRSVQKLIRTGKIAELASEDMALLAMIAQTVPVDVEVPEDDGWGQ